MTYNITLPHLPRVARGQAGNGTVVLLPSFVAEPTQAKIGRRIGPTSAKVWRYLVGLGFKCNRMTHAAVAAALRLKPWQVRDAYAVLRRYALIRPAGYIGKGLDPSGTVTPKGIGTQPGWAFDVLPGKAAPQWFYNVEVAMPGQMTDRQRAAITEALKSKRGGRRPGAGRRVKRPRGAVPEESNALRVPPQIPSVVPDFYNQTPDGSESNAGRVGESHVLRVPEIKRPTPNGSLILRSRTELTSSVPPGAVVPTAADRKLEPTTPAADLDFPAWVPPRPVPAPVPAAATLEQKLATCSLPMRFPFPYRGTLPPPPKLKADDEPGVLVQKLVAAYRTALEAVTGKPAFQYSSGVPDGVKRTLSASGKILRQAEVPPLSWATWNVIRWQDRNGPDSIPPIGAVYGEKWVGGAGLGLFAEEGDPCEGGGLIPLPGLREFNLRWERLRDALRAAETPEACKALAAQHFPKGVNGLVRNLSLDAQGLEAEADADARAGKFIWKLRR